MSSIVVAGDTSGSVTLSAPAVAGTTTLTLPSVSGTVTTNTTLAGADANIHGLTVGLGGGNQSANTSLGYQAGLANTTGNGNVFTGFQAGLSNTTGISNVFIGGTYASSAGNKNTTGSSNTGIGTDALASNTTASNNTAVGYQALYTNTTAGNNTAMGYQAGLASTGAYNTCFGYSAGISITTGGSNTCIGPISGGVVTTGSNNTYIGYTNASSAAVGGETVLGYNLTGKGSNTSYIGGAAYQGNNSSTWSVTSDQRLKKNIVDNNTGLDAISAIQVRNFEYRLPEEVTELEEHCAIQKEGVQLGVIAQELQLVLPDCVKEESTGVLSVNSDNLTWYLINAVKELSAELDALKLKVGAV